VWDERPETREHLERWTARPDGSTGFLAAGAGTSALLWVEFVKGWLPIRPGDRVVEELNGLGFFVLTPERYVVLFEPETSGGEHHG
jgi:hypothetical protein